MRFLVSGLMILALVAGAMRADDKKADTDGWVQMFDGKTLDGWKSHPKSPGKWKVEDGAIVGTGGVSHLFSEKGEYRNFRFRMEIMINDKGNSGQYVRAQFGPGFPLGWEVQINATHTDPIRTGSIYPDYRQKDLQEEKVRKEILVLKADHKPGEWFTQEVVCVGPKITTYVNGKKAAEWTDPKERFKKGHFAIQQHDPGSVVKVRKVEVKELPEEK